MTKHYQEIDAMRGIAILLVLFGHSIIVFPINLMEIGWCAYLHRMVSTVHLPMFFALAGYCFHFRGWKSLLEKKGKRILLPYLVFSLLGIVPNLLFPSLVNAPLSLKDCLLGILEGSSYWFLYVLFFLFLLFSLLVKPMEKRPLALGILLLLVLNEVLFTYPDVCNLPALKKYAIYFAFGYCVSRFASELTDRDRLKRLLEGPACWISLLLWLGMASFRVLNHPEESSMILRLLDMVIAVCGLLFWLCFVKRVRSGRFMNGLIGCGKVSLQLYLFNGYFLTFARTLTIRVLQIHEPVLIILIVFFFSSLVSYWFIQLVIRRVKLFRIAVGMV